jgi:glycosyltransferase involved in cell wall biosynthesis
MTADRASPGPLRILWVRVGGLWPLNSGGRVRTFQTVAHLSRGHRVTLLTTHGPEDDPAELRRQLPACEEVVSVPYAQPKRGTGRFVLALLRSWLSLDPVDLVKTRVPALRAETRARVRAGAADICVADFLHSLSNLPANAGVPVVLFEHNVEHLIWKRLAAIDAQPWRRALLELEWRKMRRREATACRRASLTVAVSETDRLLLAAAAPGARVCAVPTGVDTSYFSPDGHRQVPTRLVFTGALDWYPNEDAMLHFVGTILPIIRRQVPRVSLTVVGRKPSARMRAGVEGAPGVTIAPDVDDVRPYMGEAAVYVVPLRVGGGTRLKIFEALAMRLAVVSTGVGAEGLPLVPGEHYVRADEPEAFAAAVVELLCDRPRRETIARAGRRLVEERYSWPQVVREFASRCQEAVAGRAG